MTRGRNQYSRAGGARHWVALLVLAMLGLRALVPAGFMLAPIDGRLAIVLCDSSAAHHHHGRHEHSGGQHTATDPTCPYAQSSGPAPLPTLAVPGVATIAGVQQPALIEAAQTHPGCGPTPAACTGLRQLRLHVELRCRDGLFGATAARKQ